MRMKRVLSLVLAAVMMLSFTPVVYAESPLASYSVNGATTTVGEMPLLPDRAVLTFENGDVLIEYITWNEFDESLYAQEGSFEVTGITESGYEVKTTVTVEKDSDTDVASGLIAYYNFDYDDAQPSMISDISGNGNDAKVLNTVVEGDGGWNPGANNVLTITDGIANFPGNTSSWWTSYLGAALKLPNNINSDVESFSYSAWIKADGEYASANKMTRFFDFGNLGSGTNNPRDSIFARYTSSSGLLRIQDRGLNVYQEDTISSRPFTDVWGHFAFVYEKNEETGFYETKVYINGEEVSGFSTTNIYTRALSDLGTLTDVNNGFFIGRTVWGATNQEVADNPDFKGQMDEIRLYSRALTEGQVKYLYETTAPIGMIEMTDYYVDDVTTFAGDYPLLPETVTVYYNTGAEKEVGVTWDVLSSDMYANEGTFNAGGYTEEGNYVEVKVIVIKKDTSTLNEGLLAYYTFNDDEATPDAIIDSSGNNNNASVHNLYREVSTGGWGGGTTTVVERKMSVEEGVLHFPGAIIGEDAGLTGRNQRNQFFSGPAIRMPDGINEGAEEFTYAAWIYADTDYRYSSSLQRFFDFGKDVRDSFFFRYVPSTGEARFQDRGAGSGSDDANSLIAATLEDNPFADKWAHLVVTYEKSTEGEYYTPHIYIDGVERYEFDNSLTTLTRDFGASVSSASSNYGMWIGKTQWAFDSAQAAYNPEFKGKMDEIRLYDRALSSQEVTELYNLKKPSDVPVDYDSMPKTKIAVVEDVEVSTAYTNTNREGQSTIMVSSNNGAANTRYAFMRLGDLSTAQLTSMANCEKAVLSVYVTLIDNWGSNDAFYCYGLTGEATNWDVNTITMNNYSEQIGGSISNVGVSEVGELLDTQYASGQMRDFYMQWDVTEFVKAHAAEDFSFLLTCGSNVAYINASESGIEGQMPELIVYQQGTPITVNRVDTEGNQISSSIVYGVAGSSYTYNVADALVSYNNAIYVVNKELSSLTVETVTGEDVIEVVYDKATDLRFDSVNVRTYIGKAPTLPRVLNVYSGNYSAVFAVQWESIDSSLYAQKGEFAVNGTVLGTDETLEANVVVFPEYNGQVGGDLTLYIYADGELKEEKKIQKVYGSSFTLDSSYENYLGTLYVLDEIKGDITEVGQSIAMISLDQSVELYFVMKEAVEGDLTVKIKADNFDQTSYTLSATAKILNTEKNDEKVQVMIASYNDDDELVKVESETMTVTSRTGDYVTLEKRVAYNESYKNAKIFLWNDMKPVSNVVLVKDVPVSGYMSEEVYGMIPTYDSAVATARSANDYWQNNYSYNTWTNGIHPSFWARAAYHTGNMELYRLIGDEDYLQYSVDWANYNNWVGNPSTSDPSQWTWGYNQDYNSNAVLFGDWQICFQSYLDMYEFGVEDANIERVFEVMDYQISKEEDDFWWWADALYMVMPVMTKLYKNTGDEKYLGALYKYFRFSKELMYDGPGGIPTDAEGYTTTAYTYKKSGSYYSDPEDYRYLFYRDAGYAFPLNPNSGHADEKNFWARGDGWVFAGLAKVLTDMPQSYEHYDEFYNTYMEMAPAIIACQQTDENGYGFWTQSMLQDYPKGNNGNDEGYETSGTAFFTYGLFWGINNGLLDEEIYLEPTLRAWGYLENVALHSNGKVGSVQPIGSNATNATPYDTTQDFGVGAYLLACCEAARYAENQN